MVTDQWVRLKVCPLNKIRASLTVSCYKITYLFACVSNGRFPTDWRAGVYIQEDLQFSWWWIVAARLTPVVVDDINSSLWVSTRRLEWVRSTSSTINAEQSIADSWA